MKRTIICIALLCCSIVLLTCSEKTDPADPEKCGELEEFSCEWFYNKNIIPWNDPTFNSYIEGSARVFQVTAGFEDSVCIDKHILYDLLAIFADDQPRVITVRLQYRYGIFGVFGNSRDAFPTIESGHATYTARGDFGIKNAYSASPGAFLFYVEWIVAASQDYSADLEYFKSKFKASVLSYDFNYPK